MSLLSRLAVQAARAYGILSSADKNKVAASYLVVAGGGGGGSLPSNYACGGGGAGGYQTSTFTLSTLNTYAITVGAGGNIAASGSNSVVSGTGLTTVTSIGGGFGGISTGASAGGNGGSGGGGGSSGGTNGAGGTGTSGQGNNGAAGNGVNGVSSLGGGGGGAGAAGSLGTSNLNGGNGGNGLASSISGSSVTYAGGGGGGTYEAGSGGTGGTGGGGNGSNPSTNSVAGTANRGGGGGGGNNATAKTSAAGGSGIVIISYASATPKFVGGTLTTSGGNQIHTFTSSGTLSPLTPVTASYLVVAGGGGAATNIGGGGGAGGLLTSSTTLYSGATYVVTVGAGGSGGSGAGDFCGSNGSNYILSGRGHTTITARGGGGGGSNATPTNAGNGGSGGGSGEGSSFGTGTSGQGNNGGTAFDASGAYGAGGGGGASAVGANGSSSSGGNGGAGTASSITGTSVTYAGGGGGGGIGTVGSGGAGGGGNANATSGGAGTSGTTNLGGGGGAGGGSYGAGGAGGSGTVIISYAGSQQFNGGLVTSSGGNTIHTFNATGALTPLTNNLTNSLRFRKSASAYLSRTPTATGSQQKFTLSTWVKLGDFTTGADSFIWASADNAVSGVNPSLLWKTFDGSYKFIFDLGTGGILTTTQVFRDPSAWYHIVISADTTQATAANRLKMYINGNQVTAFTTATYPTQNTNILINTSSYPARIGGVLLSSSTDRFFDGYMTDINFIDGQALEPYYFGNNDANQVWKPIQYKGTYGTNGFYLTFADTSALTTSSNVGLGKDTSGNGNYWTTNNISITAGSTYDAMTDVPTNTSATVANYCTLNPLPYYGGYNVLSRGNLQFTSGNTNWMRALATFAVSSGKWYWEVTMNNIYSQMHGILTATTTSYYVGATNWVGYDATGYAYFNDGNKWNNNAGVAYGATWTAGDIIGIAFDADNGKLYFSKNGTFQASGDPAAGTNAAFTGLTNGPYVPAVSVATTSGANTCDANFGQRPFAYTPPTGFVALNTFNLPTPTILQGNKYMDATLYTGNGASTQVIVNQGQFKPDLVWDKARSNTDTNSNMLVNSVVGRAGSLSSNQTSAEGTSPSDKDLISFNSNGFTVGPASQANMNTSGWTFVAWQWQAGQGSTSSNTSGSITSTVSVSTTAGFSIVTYTGTGANATVGHGLGVAPKMIITRYRGSESWSVYHTSLGGTKTLYLNLTNAANTTSLAWNNTDPTSTVFSLGSAGTTNTSGGSGMVAYCWAEIAGFSKFGSYTGNGSTDGPFIYLGFRPKWVLIKRTDSSTGGNWSLLDSSINTYNEAQKILTPNTADSESTQNYLDLLSNGFKVRYAAANQQINTNGGSYIYAAFAENPFKNSNAR